MSVRELIADPHSSYEVPIYQRNYSWRAQEIEQLIEDVWAAAQESEESYFLGNLIVAERPVPSGSTHHTFEVIDGQQRLTTIHLLLKHLKVETASKLTYESRRTSITALERIDSDEADDGSSSLDTGFRAIAARMVAMDAEPDPDTELPSARFAQYLLDHVQVVRASLPEHTDLNRYFEIMNTRGQQLEQVDIVKASLMGYLRGPDVDEARACFAWIWDACAEMNSYIQMSLAPKKTELRSKIFGERWDRLAAPAFDDLLRVRSEDGRDAIAGVSSTKPLNLRGALAHYARQPARTGESAEDASRFESPIKFASLLLHALKVLQGTEGKVEDDGQLDDRNLIRLFDGEFKFLPDNVTKELGERHRSDRVKRFAETLLRCKFILDNYVIKREFTSTNSEDGAWSLKRLVGTPQRGKDGPHARFLNTYGSGQDQEDDETHDDLTRGTILLQSMLRITYTSPRTMHWMTMLLRHPLPIESTPEALRGYGSAIQGILRNYARRKVREAYFEGDDKKGFAIQRIVFTYLDFLLASPSNLDFQPDPGFTFAYRSSVEHFFPQHPNREQTGWDAVVEDEKHLLGNLALVSVVANSKFSNSLPRTKATYLSIRQQSPKLEMMARIAEQSTWDSEAVMAHHAAMEELLRRDVRAGPTRPEHPGTGVL